MNKFLTILTEKNILCMCTVQLYINCTIYNGLGHNILYLRSLLCGFSRWEEYLFHLSRDGEEKYIRLPRDAFFFSARVAAHARCVFVVHSFVSAAVRRVGSGLGTLVLVMAE